MEFGPLSYTVLERRLDDTLLVVGVVLLGYLRRSASYLASGSLKRYLWTHADTKAKTKAIGIAQNINALLPSFRLVEFSQGELMNTVIEGSLKERI